MTTEERIKWLDDRISEARALEKRSAETPHAIYYIGLRHAYQNVKRDLDLSPEMRRAIEKFSQKLVSSGADSE